MGAKPRIGGLILPAGRVTEGHVQSHSRQGQHKVNLADYPVNGIPNGSCTCEAFAMGCLPRLRKSNEVIDSADMTISTRCKHIRDYREWLANTVIDRIGECEERSIH